MTEGFSRRDWLAAAVLWAATVLVFAPGAGRLGFYYDDSGWMSDLAFIDLAGLWAVMIRYVPGRHLFPLWHYLLFQLSGEPAAHLTTLHLMHSALDGLVVACFFLLLRLLCLPVPAAVAAAGLFSFWPIHGETHFWNDFVANLLSVLFVLVFTMTSVVLTRQGAGSWRLRLLDAAAFLCALFTYDQVFFVVVGIVVLRLGIALRERIRSSAVAHLPHLAAVVFFLWLKLGAAAGSGPELRAEPRWVVDNILVTGSATAGRLWLGRVAPLYERVTTTDWLLAFAVAALLSVVAGHGRHSRQSLRRVFLLGVAFYVAAYLPVWLWHPAQRHHYLPSLGLWAAAGAGLAWILERARSRMAQLVPLLAAGVAMCAFAAADRGESRFWEESFRLKKQLFADLKPDLEGKEALVLEGFPFSLGPAYLISPQDCEHAPRLIYQPPIPLHPRFAGDISASPAPGGLFLYTLAAIHGPRAFRYRPTENFLLARFTGLENNRLTYQKNPERPLPYRVLPALSAPGKGPFHVHHLSARRQGNDMIVSLRVQAQTERDRWLVALPGYFRDGHFDYWGRSGVIQPVLLSERGSTATSALELDQTLELVSFPAADRLRLEFFLASRENPPVVLGRAEAAVEP